MPRTSHAIALLLIACVAFASRSHSRAADAGVPSFATDIQPLLVTRCGQCHGEKIQKSALALHTADAIRRGSESGPVIVPGKSAESLLLEKLELGEMPPDDKNALDEEQIELVRRWIDGGAPFGTATEAARPELSQHDIIPIMLLRCTVCHGTRKQEGKLDLRTRAAMLRGGKSGPAFVPGQPTASLMLKRIHAQEMPPLKRLTEVAVKPMDPAEVDQLTRWIALGAPEVAAEPDLAGTPADPLVTAEDRQFWSFRAPQAVTPPAVAHTDRVRNPIDPFVLAKLEEKKITLAPEADRLTLLRRATYDLTGLPPEPAEIDAFLADNAEGAYERLIDRLLASPRYGERWARHWLDVAGYADCEGRREQHLPRPFAWRYRDYVIRAFNADKPYDRFLLEQIAGDELFDYQHATEITPEIEDALVATAFLRLAPDPTWANLTGFVPDRLEVMADMIDILGSGVMGLTFKCARCHSHKFDPIPQRDYYRLAAIFKGAYDEHDWLQPQIIGFGGALSAGPGERFLSQVNSAERQRWQLQCDNIDRQIAALQAGVQSPEVQKQIDALRGQRPAEPRVMALWDRGEPSPTYIYRRGDYQSPGAPVEPGVPAALADGQGSIEIKLPRPGATSTGRRLAFARWLTRPEQPLTARVIVNRVWQLHFGRGIVDSVGNFGRMGSRPTHPELLDWLAVELMRQNWSLKQLHKLMLTSSVYRQSSTVAPQSEVIDPGNRLWSRMPLRRLDAEQLRDSLLAISAQLDERRFGPADAVQVHGDGLVSTGKRRSIYVEQLRKHPVSLLESFDLPAMNPNCLQRTDSLVAPQALYLLNDSAVRDMAAHFAARVEKAAGDNPAAQVRHVYVIALGRPPDAMEQAACIRSLLALREQWTAQFAGEGATGPAHAARQALTTLCHTIMNSAALLYID